MNLKRNFPYFIPEKLIHVAYAILLFMVYIPSCDARKDYNTLFVYLAGMLISVGTLLSNTRINRMRDTRIRITHAIIWGLVVISVFPSFLFGSVDMGTIGRYILIYVFYIILWPNGNMSVEDVAWAAVLSNVYICYRCIFEIGVKFSYYQGTMVNPNQFALTLIGGVISIIYLLCVTNNKLVKGILIALEGLFLAFMWFSSSRTNMMAILIVVLVFAYHYFREELGFRFKVNHYTNRIAFGILVGVGASCLVLAIGNLNALMNFFLNKWNSGASGMLSGRGDIWKEVLEGASFWYGSVLKVNTNSEYFNWINQNGILSGVMFISFILFSFIIVLKNYLSEKNLVNIYLLMIVITYMWICLFENILTLFGKPINIMFFCALGYAIHGLGEEKENICG